MHRDVSDSRAVARLERAAVLELLNDESETRPTPAELAAALGAGPEAVDAALEALRDAGVLVAADGRVWASDATRHLDGLQLIGI